MLLYSAEGLRTLQCHDVTVPRVVRKAIFILRLWRPRRQRLHAQRQDVNKHGTHNSVCINSDLSIGCVNARSIAGKSAVLCKVAADYDLDVLVITETWHESISSVSLKRATPAGFKFIECARPIMSTMNVHDAGFQNHGGLAFFCRQDFQLKKKLLDVQATTFEYLCCMMNVKQSSFLLLGVYRPGSQSVSSLFFDELVSLLEQISLFKCPIVVCGDFNIHVDDTTDPHAVRFLQLLESFDCRQHVDTLTHIVGHTLDLVITRRESAVHMVKVRDLISDHFLITFKLCIKKTIAEQLWTTSRAWR